MTVSVMAHYVDRQPYVGARPFLAEEAGQFFGRSEAVSALAERWQRHRVSVLTGPPGSGKTSLLHAKLVDAAHDADVLPVGRPFGPPPPALAALPGHNPYTLALLSSWSPSTPQNHLAGLTLYEFLRSDGWTNRRRGRPGPLLVAIDQVERVFERHPRLDPHRVGFLVQLREVVTELPDVHLLLSVREEGLAGLEAALGRLESPYRLGPLTMDEAVQAVERPVEGSGRWYAEGVAEQLVTTLAARRQSVDPVLLQAVCSRLWAALPAEATVITAQDVHAHPGIDRSLREFCGQVIADVALDHHVSTLRLASWLQRAAATGTDIAAGDDDAAREGFPRSVLQSLQDRYLLAAGHGSYRLHHELLAGPLTRLDVTELRAGDTTPARHLSAAESALFRGDLDAADQNAGTALATAGEDDLPLLARAESRLGDIAHLRGDYGQAVAHYRAVASLFEALQVNTAVANSLAAIGHALLAQGLDVEAVETMRSAVDRLPTDLALQTEFGRTLWQAGQGRAGVTVLTDVLNSDSRTPEALRTRGEMLADLGQSEKALLDLNQVRRHLRPEGRAARALALVGTGNSRDAEEDMEAALQAGTQNGPALLYAARVRALGSNRSGAADLARMSLAATAPALAPHQRAEALQLSEIGPTSSSP
jgi:tetratricopeptide (TPR) repeat protein